MVNLTDAGAAAREAAAMANLAAKMATFRAAARVLAQELAAQKGADLGLGAVDSAEWAALLALVQEVRAHLAGDTAAGNPGGRGAGSPDCWVPR